MHQASQITLTISLSLFLLLFFSSFFSLVPPRKSYRRSASLTGTHKAIAAAHSRRMLHDESKSYVVVFDAGSTGSRVHVFCFDGSMNLLPFDDDTLEFYKSVKPGLSSYAGDPEAAANSLRSLLEAAESNVPTAYHSETPLRLGATAGVRALDSNVSAAIMEAVRTMLKNESSFEYKEDWVTILDGSEEGAYLWVAINYLLGNLGNEYSNTVGVVDLGGGSVQMAYAISKTVAIASPTTDGEYTYVKQLSLEGFKYYLYIYSYADYGLLAARAEILKAIGGLDNPCILEGYDGYYNYSGTVYNVSASDSGSNFTECRQGALRALNVNESCSYTNCTFQGVWSGGGGAGQDNLYVGSFFYDRAIEVGIMDSDESSIVVMPLAFKEAAQAVCNMTLETANKTYTSVSESDLPYLCMDLVYQYTLLIDGFGLDPEQNITVVESVEYGNYTVDAAWPLGGAIDVLSSSTLLSSL